MYKKEISEWIDHISANQYFLGNFPVCPFAKKAIYKIEKTTVGDLIPPTHDFELIIYVLPDETNLESLHSFCDHLNSKFLDLVFLPDHKSRNTYIQNIKTNNGKYNLILCQPRKKLEEARNKLKKTDYYSFWNKDYLEEILKT